MQFISRASLLAALLSASTAVACSGNIGDITPGARSETPSEEPFAPAAARADTASADAVEEAIVEDAVSSEDTVSSADTGPDAAIAVDSAAPLSDSAPPVIDTTVAVDSAPPVVDSAPPPVTTAATEYAPYFYTWGWGNSVYPFTSLVDMEKKTGLRAATLAFVTASSGTCATTRGIPNHASDLAAFRAVGGRLKASFGGALGTYIENGCTTTASLTTAIESFVDETGITDLDFDVEQSIATTATVNARRAAALAAVQKAKGIKVSFTLQANPASTSGVGGGMTSGANAVVKAALDAGVTISHVNLMTMDYGETISTGRRMGEMAISAVNACHKQLKTLLPALADSELYAMIGATPMIGQNDVSSEVFSLDDARTLIDFAKTKHLGLVAFWAIQRDVPCSGAIDLVLCSGAQTANYQFNAIFKTVL
jgi:hypothetical protein